MNRGPKNRFAPSRGPSRAQPAKRLVAAKLSPSDSALLDRACARLRITRTEAVHRGVRSILERQRELEAMAPEIGLGPATPGRKSAVNS